MIKLFAFLVTFCCLAACSEQNTFHACSYNLRDIPQGLALYQNGQFDELVAYIEPDAIAGVSAAQEFLGELLYQSNPEEAFAWLSLAAEQQCLNAALMIGQMYEEGHGVGQDSGLAFQWFIRLAESGNPNAAHMVSGMYLTGSGVDKDEELHYYWLEKAFELSPAAR